MSKKASAFSTQKKQLKLAVIEWSIIAGIALLLAPKFILCAVLGLFSLYEAIEYGLLLRQISFVTTEDTVDVIITDPNVRFIYFYPSKYSRVLLAIKMRCGKDRYYYFTGDYVSRARRQYIKQALRGQLKLQCYSGTSIIRTVNEDSGYLYFGDKRGNE